MPYNGSGSFILAQAAFVPGTPISSSAMNSDLADIATNGLTNAVVKDGQTIITGAFKGANGTVSLPMYSFASDLDSGMYRIGANHLGIGVGAAEVLDISTSGLDVTGSLTVNGSPIVATGLAPFEALAYNGMQINGSTDVSQENGTTAVALATGVAAYIIDMWQGKFVRAATLAISCQQVTPPGSPSFQSAFQNALQIKATTGLGSLANGDYGFLEQTIEGYRVSQLDFGSAGAASVTIGFWVYATISGTMTVALLNSAVNRAIPVNVVINNATTWEFKTVTFAGDTSGTWLFTNGVGLRVRFCFGAGSTFQGTNNTWTGSEVFATSSTTNFFASTNNLACITGLVVLPGSQAPTAAQSPLIMRPYDQELLLCFRQFFMWRASIAAQRLCAGGIDTATTMQSVISFPAPFRASPTISFNGLILNSQTVTVAAIYAGYSTAAQNMLGVGFTVGGGLVGGQVGQVYGLSNAAYFTMDARL